MGWYAAPSWRLARQVVSDLFVAAWAVAWFAAGRFADATVRALATPARETARTAGQLKGQLTDAAANAAGVPVVGGGLRQPFDAMSGTVDALASAASTQATDIERAATVLGWLVFLIPVLTLIARWLPGRLAYARAAGELRALAQRPEGAELLALRALGNRPLAELAPIAPDPVACWRRGDAEVIGRLASLELRAMGVRVPRGAGPGGTTGSTRA